MNEKEYIEAIKEVKLIEAIEPGVLESALLIEINFSNGSLVEFVSYSIVFG